MGLWSALRAPRASEGREDFLLVVLATVAHLRIGRGSALAALVLVACVAPINPTPPSPLRSPFGSLAPSLRPSTGASPRRRSPGSPTVVATISLANVVDLASAPGGGAWFITMGRSPSVGRLSVDAIASQQMAGPAPVAIAASSRSVFVIEGKPDSGPQHQARTDVLERLDPASLAVLRSVATPATVDVALTPGLVWTISTEGTVTAYDDVSLVSRWSTHLNGHGQASISGDSDVVWAAIGSVGDEGSGHYVVERIDPATLAAFAPLTVPGDGVGPTVVAGHPAWLAVADDPVHDRLYAIEPDGSARAVGSIAAPAGMASNGETVWSAGVDGSVTIVDASSGEIVARAIARYSGAAVAVSAELAYVSIGDQVDVMAQPRP